MDPNAVVLDISSDDEPNWDVVNTHKDIIIDANDDYNWIADILDEVNRDDCGYDDDDSDDVVVVSEVLPKKPRRKLPSKSTSVIDFDDDCVVLDHDPDNPPEPRNDNPIDRQEDDDDSDDIVVVSEKGQVACRDYPHPRHLCIKFPFSTTPNQSHCDQCYCYVCDSLAPCIYWGNGSGTIDHCLATDKINFWVLERKNSKNVGKDVNVPLLNPVPQATSMDHNPTLMANPIPTCPVTTASFFVPNAINRDQSSLLLSRNSKYQPSLVSQKLTRTSSCTIPGGRVNHSFYLGAPLHRPVFKRTQFGQTASRYSYSSYYRDNYRSHFPGSSPPNISQFDLPPNFQPLVNANPHVEVPVLFQPNPAPSSTLPQYTVPSEASRQESQRSTVDSRFFNGISWPQNQVNHHSVGQSSLLEVGSTNEPPLASGSGGLVDFGHDNWMFNDQPVEPGSMDGSGPFGLSESPDPSYMDSCIFDF
ncbi:uncharacterized protein LOC143634434 [Bidens hawaiensis]|uniref:uncharacterized protein LOC143634434 n=1 Tax=Bidens hawaiensis TaxID=980011 RepID=UPI00404B8613